MSQDSLCMLGLFAFLFTFRYLRTLVSIITFNLYRPKPIQANPSYTAKDVTVIVPTTFKSETELTRCLDSICACSPAAVFLVTSYNNVSLVQAICSLRRFPNVEVLGVAKLNKRRQMILALQEVKTDITVFADDDVFWPDDYLDYLLAIFEDPRTGAGGTRQRARRNPASTINFWNFLGIAYLERRAWNNIATNAIDGSLSTLSGRTAAYRTQILQNEEFYHYLMNDKWRGKPLNSDDDKCLTRYVYSHGWEITIQSDPRSVIETTLEDNPKYIDQCLRWARAHWRGNLIVMETEKYWCSRKYFWGWYVIYVGQFQTPALFWDALLFAILVDAVSSYSWARSAYIALAAWIFFTKNLKMIPHYMRYPQDMVYVPLSVLLSYLHGFLNIYAAMTLTKTHWGSQKLDALEHARAKNGAVIPFLKNAMAERDAVPEPTAGKLSQIPGSDGM